MGDNDDDICGNTSEDNDLKSKNQDSAGPANMISMPTKEQAMKKGENIQPIHTAEQMEKKRWASAQQHGSLKPGFPLILPLLGVLT